MESEEQAQALLDPLLLAQAKLMTYEVMAVGPLMPLGRLILAQ